MNYNGRNWHVDDFLQNIVHAAAAAEYSAKVSPETVEAAELQKFFQSLKHAAQNRKMGMPVSDGIIETILDNVQAIGQSRHAKFNVGNLFGVRGGNRFENELTRVIEAVFMEVSDDDFNKEAVNIGSKRGNINKTSWLDEDVQRILKKVGTKTYHKIKREDGKTLKEYYLQDVDGKIDVMGYQVNIRANATPEMLKIYNLLSQATFTAKNYDSMTWDEKCEIFIEQVGHTSIKLGDSNVYRALYGSLSSLGYDEETTDSAIFAGMNLIKKGNPIVATHFYHLRFIYELTGAGFQYQGQNFGGAKYLIYNDPHGNIYVKSTAQIVSDILNDHSVISMSKALGNIYISKKAFA